MAPLFWGQARITKSLHAKDMPMAIFFFVFAYGHYCYCWARQILWLDKICISQPLRRLTASALFDEYLDSTIED